MTIKIKNLTAELFIHVDTRGEHGRGDTVSAELVAKVTNPDGEFLGNWSVFNFKGPNAEASAYRLLNKYMKRFRNESDS